MCRIAGIIDKRSSGIEEDIVSMRDAMRHGGPDSEGVHYDPEAGLALGHRRLSIIDLSSGGDQPMYNEPKDLVLIFNGEIYNYLLLRDELIRLGARFFSHSDTEVILKAYEQWGTACFGRLKGMFALALHDKRKRELILARDHAGIKPLYYADDGQSLYFASEIRAFKTLPGKWEEHPSWRVHFLTYGFLPAPVTTLKNVKPLEKGSFRVFNTDTLQSKQSFFFHDEFTEDVCKADEAIDLVQRTLTQAVKRHLIADAPLGLFLSGGIDSSLLTILANSYKKDLHTLSIIFDDEKYSEKYYQDIIVRQCQTNHQSFLLNETQFIEAVPDILKAMDQPSADGINSYFISKFAKEAGLKAVLSGLGADELFGGYPSFKRLGLVNRLKKIPDFLLQSASRLPQNKYQKISFLSSDNDTGDYLFNRGYYTPGDTARLLDMDVKEVRTLLGETNRVANQLNWSEGNKMSFLESTLYMEDQLLKDTDFMSMWHSIEVRVPFLDYDLVKAVRSISSELKFGHPQGKFLLIESFKKVIPAEIWDRKKKGFQLPFDDWMKNSFEHLVTTARDRKIKKRFNNTQLSWSRYWAYLLSRTFAG
jgi:asparagine synthase (glutamine-hydrolysing)